MKSPKVTKNEDGAHGRWYDDACGTAFALELIGERWSLLIVRELMFGGRRFGELREAMPAISAKTLTERLASLERAGIVERRRLPPPASAQLYALTPWGHAAEPALKALGYWAASSPGHDPTLPLSPASLMLSLRTLFDAERARATVLEGELVVGHERFRVAVADGALVVARGEADAPHFVIRAPRAEPFAAAFYGKVPFAALAAAGLVVEGDPAAAQAFAASFALPPKFAPPEFAPLSLS